MFCNQIPYDKIVPLCANTITPSIFQLFGIIENEVWKPVMNYNGVFKDAYEVSDLGRVRSIARKNVTKSRFLTATPNRKGYLLVKLSLRSKDIKISKSVTIHSLVGLAHVPNPHNHKQINHKKCNKKDNRATELEWCTHAQNMKHAVINGRFSNRHPLPTNAKKVNQYSINGKYIGTFESAASASRHFKGVVSAVSASIINKTKALGYIWAYDGVKPDFTKYSQRKRRSFNGYNKK